MPPETQPDHHGKNILRSVLHQPLLPPYSKILHGKRQNNTYCATSLMKFPRILLPVFIFLLSSITTIRLIKIMLIIQSPSSTLAAEPPTNSTTSSDLLNISGRVQQMTGHHTALTKKEFQFLSSLIARRAPCNLLIFGLKPQYSSLPSMTRGGYTIFLEDNPEKLGIVRINSSTAKVYMVKYNTSAADAFSLLKYARTNQVCKPNQGQLTESSCKLALTDLPSDVYNIKWDVIVVDGPRGHRPGTPGRMAAIYTASMLARAIENSTEVIVHDVDRMIEKWFSWEFLCDENLTSSKGKLWNFTITKHCNSTSFCAARK